MIFSRPGFNETTKTSRKTTGAHRRAFLLGETMSGWEDPALRDDGASTDVTRCAFLEAEREKEWVTAASQANPSQQVSRSTRPRLNHNTQLPAGRTGAQWEFAQWDFAGGPTWISTCHGQAPCVASSPPTILFSTIVGRPHCWALEANIPTCKHESHIWICFYSKSPKHQVDWVGSDITGRQRTMDTCRDATAGRGGFNGFNGSNSPVTHQQTA